MDSRYSGYSDSINGLRFNGVSVPNQNIMNVFKLEEQTSLDHNFVDLLSVPPDHRHHQYQYQNQYAVVPSSSVSHEEDSSEDCDFSDTVLKYISQMLMEEDMEEKSCMFQESSAIQAAEKPFYEILGEKYPPSPNHHPLDHNLESSVDNSSGNYSHYNSSSSTSSSSNPVENNWVFDVGDYKSTHLQTFPADYAFQATPQSSLNDFVDGLIDSPASSSVNVSDMYCENEPAWHFQKGVEEASKFLPNGNNLFIDLESNGLFPREPKKEPNGIVVKEEKKEEDHSPNESRGKKNLHRIDIDLEEGRSNKHSAVFTEEPLRTEMFDRVLLCNGNKDNAVSSLQEALKTEVSKNGQSKASHSGKSRGRKQSAKKDVVDLRTLLIHCAQSVAADDCRSANELLKQIRQHSSPFGDGNQRLAHCFADGLEARLAGTGSQSYSTLLNKRTSAADILKAYQLYLAACPFKKISNFFSNQTIMNISENATSVHIVDFGIYYGFQWPCLIEKLSHREGGPPKLRITGVDLPQPGFRPAERVEETGRRLRNYAESFNVPFEYNAIAKKWETVQIEDLKIEPGELLIVNCLYRFRNLLDETVVLDSPRNAVLKLIRKMNPAVFIHGIINGAFSAPFFITRFREALFHYSSIFDMLETNVPREHPERILLERDLFGREAMNIIACEGSERVERPETYKQWQVRNMRAGFQQLPLRPDCMKRARDRVKSSYHKDFVIDQDSQWMLQGWKGRIIYALSTWRPVSDS
ncbi:Scarecrow-like protein [Thalictrum thalictroides]|uniref:Scarecrow-like protein n=1 Tax=Thalictrum thalictroides TaxID=46969 RepID=A0A7J6W8Y4_THATH|nr:Scarecrow-like protein [Thalictrum thalictroides]